MNSGSPLRARDAKPTRITLTKKQCESDGGRLLIAALTAIAEDGVITAEECQALRQNIAQYRESLPAADFLSDLLDRSLADKHLGADELWEIKNSIERVLPKPIREEVKQKLSRIEEPATEPQLQYIASLGYTAPKTISKREASELLTNILEGGFPTKRQMMVLRFWNRLDLANLKKAEVSAWMDNWYAENPYRREAWELFKKQTGDDGRQRDPAIVPIGIGPEYLAKVMQPAPKSSCLIAALVLLLLAIAMASVVYAGINIQ